MIFELNKHINTYYNVQVDYDTFQTLHDLLEEYVYDSYTQPNNMLVDNLSIAYVIEDLLEEEDNEEFIELLRSITSQVEINSLIHFAVQN